MTEDDAKQLDQITYQMWERVNRAWCWPWTRKAWHRDLNSLRAIYYPHLPEISLARARIDAEKDLAAIRGRSSERWETSQK